MSNGLIVKGVDDLIRRHKKYLKDKQGRLKQAVNITRIKVDERVKDTIPVDTGHARRSFRVRRVDGGMIQEYGSENPYVPFIEFGTADMVAAHGPHLVDAPVTRWKALEDRGGVGQQMPFFYPAIEAEREAHYKRIKQIFR